MSEETTGTGGKVVGTSIEEEMKTSYLRYSMSVIVARALPDARDGLKPVHRRILYGMENISLFSDRPYKKSANIVGEVMGKYHPHGDSAIYDSIVRMAQDFSMRYTLVDGQGNFGSIDGDPPAAMRYTEARMDKFAELMLQDLEKETVNFIPNYDESLQEPTVLPSAFPNLLVNGSTGIAVGMATNIPPHNLNEVVDACLHMLRHPLASVDELMDIIKKLSKHTFVRYYGFGPAEQDIIDECRERFRLAMAAESDNRKAALEDIRDIVNDDWTAKSTEFREDMMERLMRPANARNWQLRYAPQSRGAHLKTFSTQY